MTRDRRIPANLASVVEELELRDPKVVTKSLLADILAERAVNLPMKEVTDSLQRHGWLLSLRTQGAWEFAPGARAGPLGSGDRFVELRATLLRRPTLRVAIAFESAAWLHGLARRPPDRDVIAVPSGEKPPPALGSFRITRQWGNVDPAIIDFLPVWRVETLIVLMAERPMSFRSWPTVNEWLSDAVRRVSDDLVLKELDGRRRATWARTGYTLEAGGRHDVGKLVMELMPAGRGAPFYLGPRGSSGRYDRRWKVQDTILLRRNPVETTPTRSPGSRTSAAT